MSIVRIEKLNNYTVLSNQVLRNPKISSKAKGLHSYLMSLPNDWKIYVSELTNHFTDGKASISSSMKELEKVGYITKKQSKNKSGLYDGWDYTIYETLENVDIRTNDDNRKADNQKTDNKPLLSTNKLNTNNSKGDKSPPLKEEEKISTKKDIKKDTKIKISEKGLKVWELLYQHHKKAKTLPITAAQRANFYGLEKKYSEEISKNYEISEIIKIMAFAKEDNWWGSKPLSYKNFSEYVSLYRKSA